MGSTARAFKCTFKCARSCWYANVSLPYLPSPPSPYCHSSSKHCEWAAERPSVYERQRCDGACASTKVFCACRGCCGLVRSAVWLLPFAAAMCGLARSAAWLFLPFRAARGERWRGGKFSARSAACGTCGGGGMLISASPIGFVCWWNSSWSVKKEEAV